MKIAVTGATGFIGRHLVGELRERGHGLILMGRDMESLRSAFSDADPGVSLVETGYGRDLPGAVKDADAIVHLSGLRWRKDRQMRDYLANNVVPTENLYAAAAESGVRNIVFLSSIAVYNPGINALPFGEGEDCSPVTHYGVSKLMCEKIGAYYNHAFGLKIKSLRVGQVVGLEERGGFMLKDFMDKAGAGKALNVFGKGAGSRDYIYVLDVVSAIQKALEYPERVGVYNISLGKPVTHLQLAEAINVAFGNTGNLVMDPEKAEDPGRLLMANGRAKRELDWRPQWGLEEMFVDMARNLAGQKS